jgi:16S rRNA (cytosine967-C5)-methyltransferase
MITKTKNVREVIVDILLQTEKNQAYSNLLLNQAIKQHQVPAKDIGLLTEVIYGTLQRKLTIDYYIKPYLKNAKKIEDWVVILLRMTVYQMHYLDRVPDRAAIFEAVEIAKKRGHKGISSMVNGVLRSLQRNGVSTTEEIKDPIERLAIEVSHPIWMIKRWVEQYGIEETRAMCLATLEPPMSSARVNSSLITVNEVVKMLEEEGIIAKKGSLSTDAVTIEKGNIANTYAFKQGYLTIQDESSMLVARVLDPQKNDMILDSCAAPGGKTTHIAELLENTGKVVSVDLHQHKIELIDEQVMRLNLSNVETLAMDTRKISEKFDRETFDKILVDAPCSGLGVIRRKPDIKYQKSEKDIQNLASIQTTILDAIAPLLKKGGTLVYSTCTMDKEENDEIVVKFLEKHTNFERDDQLNQRLPIQIKENAELKDGQIQILPHHFGTDGFFMARLLKRS